MKDQKDHLISLLKIHTAVFCFGLSGLFAKLLILPSPIIVLGRVFFATIFLALLLLYRQQDFKLKNRQDYLLMCLLGVILALHWSTFFQAIKVSSVAIGLLSYSAFPIFVTFLEPIFFHERFLLKNIVLTFITFSGVALVVPTFSITNTITQGSLWGLLSGFCFALLSILNKKCTQQYSSLLTAFYQDAVAMLVLLPCLIVVKPSFKVTDFWLLALLGIVFTAIAHSLFISSLKHLKALTTSIIASLEPVYGIIFAAVLLKEAPTPREILGGLIIFGTALYISLRVDHHLQ